MTSYGEFELKQTTAASDLAKETIIKPHILQMKGKAGRAARCAARTPTCPPLVFVPGTRDLRDVHKRFYMMSSMYSSSLTPPETKSSSKSPYIPLLPPPLARV